MIKRLGRRLLPVLLVVACVGGVGASSASATGEYWMYENYACSGCQVSSPPHAGIYFVGLYTNPANLDSIAISNNRTGNLGYLKSGFGSITESFPAYGEAARGWMRNENGYTAKYIAETRF